MICPPFTGYAQVRFLLACQPCKLLLATHKWVIFLLASPWGEAVEQGETDEVFIIKSFSVYITTSSEFQQIW